ncbi:Retrovirus-related Pol polyprotein from transposon TNT 1-94 [Scenedesmus sp. PABB004]|nr:Retrovirus-related Pol polyprotein from transposon TNT 1-94 [Scenedesmus sp. PABB004]
MQFTVRGATLRLLQLRCAREVTPAGGWTPGVGCVPGLWRAGHGQACPASAIARREAGQKRSWAERQRAETPDPEPGLPAWQKVSPPRRHVMERVGPAAAAAAAARREEQEQRREQQLEQRRTLVQEPAANDLVDPLTGATAPARAGERAEPPAWAACYARAQQARIPRALRHFGWSLLHGGQERRHPAQLEEALQTNEPPPRYNLRSRARAAAPEARADATPPPEVPGYPEPGSAANFDIVEQRALLVSAQELGGTIIEPTTYAGAMASPQASEWTAAMAEEHSSLLGHGTWDLRLPPRGTKLIPCRWVYKIKYNTDGSVERFKARLVVKGFHQRAGIDYHEVFAPVIKYSSFRALCALAAANDWELYHVDIKTAFLNGDVEEELWMQQPPGFEQGPPGFACKLRRSLYGLKQAPRAWNQRLHAELLAMGFTQSAADPAVYFIQHDSSFLIMLVYVDDLLIATPRTDLVQRFNARLLAAFEGRCLGPVTCFLGILIERDRARRTLKISQARLISAILEKFELSDAKPRVLPLSPAARLSAADGDALDTAKFNYSALIGSIMYLAISKRPDIAYTVGLLSRFMAKPTTAHWEAARSTLRYLSGTADVGITYAGPDQHLVGFTDSDYAACIDTRRSTGGYLFTLAGGAISWLSKRQPTVAASTTEAEYLAAAAAVKEALWLRNLLRELGLHINTVHIHADNQSAIKLLLNPMSSSRSKQIDVAYHFARERVTRGEVSFSYLPTGEMTADVLTEALPAAKLQVCWAGMGLG